METRKTITADMTEPMPSSRIQMPLTNNICFRLGSRSQSRGLLGRQVGVEER